MVNPRFSSPTRALLALSAIAAAALSSSSCSSKDDKGAACASGASCGGVCCGGDQECVENSCLPVCASQIRCGAAHEHCCAAGLECTAGLICQPPLQTGNDSCSTARELQFTDAGVAREHGTTTGAQTDGLLTCATGLGGYDVVYSFALEKTQKLTVSVKPDPGSPIHPVAALRVACTNNTNLLCSAPPAAGGATTLEAGMLFAGRYFLWIAGNATGAEGAGAFALTVTLADPEAPPPNDTCLYAMPIDLATTHGHAVVHGSLASAYGNSSSNPTPCATVQPTGGPDVVYKIEVPSTRAFSARMAFDNPGSLAVAGLYLRKSCRDNAEELGCPVDVPHFAALQIAALPRGTYYLYVDTDSMLGEPFTLAVDLGAAPVNDNCDTGAQTITLDAAGKATIDGDTSLANPDSFGGDSCATASNDVVYKLHLDHDQSVSLTVTPTDVHFAPMVYVRSGCGGQGHSFGCNRTDKPQPVTLDLNRLAPGDWFIWVGGFYAPFWGSFTLSVTATDVAVPANDLCENATPLTLNPATKTANVQGSTAAGWDNYQGQTCGMRDPPMDGPDLVYKLTLTEDSSLSITLSRDLTTNSALLPAVYVRTDCASTAAADEKACVRAEVTNPDVATAQVPLAEAGVYYIIVDGVSGTAGEFTLGVVARPAIGHDTCAHPKDIPIDAATGIGSVRDDTSLARDDDHGSCQTQFSGPDLVYRFTLAQDRAVTLDLTPEGATAAGYAPALYVRQSCDERISQVLNGCAAATAGGAATHLSFDALAPGTYFVWVDGDMGAGGVFTLKITTADPPAAAPAGDTCATAIPLTLAATAADPAIARATATGDTTHARDNARGVGLAEGSAAGDLVYKVTLTAAQQLKAVVTPDAASAATFQPVVYVRGNSCASGADADQLAVGVASAAGATATAVANSLSPGTYWIWVDSLTNTGAFGLEVVASAPAAGPANDNCSAPEALTFTGTTATATGTTVGAQSDTATPTPLVGIVGGDVVYSVTATNTLPRTLTATVVGAAGAPASFFPVVTIRKRCGSLAEPLSSAQAISPTNPVTPVPVVGVTAGTYYVWIDSGQATPADPATPGPFVLTVTLEVPNDRCAGAEDLTGTLSSRGDTTDAVDQYGTNGGFAAACATALGGTTRTPGPELVYLYFAMRNFTVTVTPEAGFDAVLWVTRAWTDAEGGQASNCVAAANAAGAGGVESVPVTVDGMEQFFIMVDSAQAAEVGRFAIQVQ